MHALCLALHAGTSEMGSEAELAQVGYYVPQPDLHVFSRLEDHCGVVREQLQPELEFGERLGVVLGARDLASVGVGDVGSWFLCPVRPLH